MSIWHGVLFAGLGLEAVLCTTNTIWLFESKFFRWIVVLLCIGLLGSGTIGLIVNHWQLWLLPGIVVGYKIINLYRIIDWRLHRNHLRQQTASAFGWLLGIQLVLFGSLLMLQRTGFEKSMLYVAFIQLVVGLFLFRSTIRTWHHMQVPAEIPGIANSALPSLSVLIPARNETEVLFAALTSLVASDYPKLEIIVLDDCSTNRRTAEVIKQFAHSGVRFIQGTEPPKGWLAKNYAYERLRQEAAGEILLFCCADTVFSPYTLRHLVEVLQFKKRVMISVLPERDSNALRSINVLQAMRYYWELALPRRLFKRPPVLSSAWLIQKTALETYGGFGSVANSVSPEASFARKAVVSDAYSFIRSDGGLGLLTQKSTDEQFATSLRIRYPQLHKRIELVCLTTVFEALFLILPFVLLVISIVSGQSWLCVVGFGLASLTIIGTYYVASVLTRLSEPVVGVLSTVVGFVMDIVVLHVSMWRYEFGTVIWKDRNICLPVMHVVARSNQEK